MKSIGKGYGKDAGVVEWFGLGAGQTLNLHLKSNLAS